MTDKKLTDNEIVKALGCCSKPVGENCKECPLHLTDCLKVNIEELALDLINRLQAENERLKKDVSVSRDAYLSMKDRYEYAKAEAYKECIEKVKEHSNKTELVCSGALVRTDYTITKESLDNLLKELVG